MYFQKVAELEHLTKAAEALHIAQPALSRTIRSMEEELDVSLFTHQGRNIHLTRDGHILLKYTTSCLNTLIRFWDHSTTSVRNCRIPEIFSSSL